MNTKSFVTLATLALAAGGAFADDITYAAEYRTFTPQTTRAEVGAEVRQARTAGVRTFVTEAGPAIPAAAATKRSAGTLTREQVRAEARAVPNQGTGRYNWAA